MFEAACQSGWGGKPDVRVIRNLITESEVAVAGNSKFRFVGADAFSPDELRTDLFSDDEGGYVDCVALDAALLEKLQAVAEHLREAEGWEWCAGRMEPVGECREDAGTYRCLPEPEAVLTKEEFHGNRLLWLAAVDKLIESFGEVCVLPLPSDAGHRLFPSVPFREGERRRQKTTLTEQKYSRQREREAERRELEYQTCFAQAQIDLAFHTPATVGSWLSRWSGVVEEHDLETIFWGWCGRFPSLSSFDRFFWQEEPLWRLIFEAGEAGRGAPVQIRALEQWMIPNKLENAI
ncbi:hypothetical protein F6139_21485 [Salmonella enterica]|uniref:Plasmid SOS inhibition protein A n=1 Tax=Salmonella enterica subsp. enterica serovar Kentucky TaxID=192955 RepID=A0A5T7DL82_SALET|nr:hypothetical protein [Salmonella enterica]EBA1146623.1 hypothetical protein [Salmonella enterica subsp. enterica serovar Kentucky]HAT0811396.1 plasmid SOS inhibition protein A [Salmonella enterica subsp. enterica]EBF3575982.1 hypothetical protein [Salmonella enterica subsp. enterica serovar Kentucky]EBI1252604.1 hypothetical protein [Salmonella enterica]